MGRPKLDQRGFSLVEVVIASILLSIVMTSSMKAFQFMSKQSVRIDDRAFATEKAVQMAEEMRGLVADSDSQISVLDHYHNNDYKYTLSVLPEVNGDPGNVHAGDAPAEPISGNARQKYKRKIFIETIPGDELARRVYVRVYASADDEVLAETMTVLRVLRNQLYPTQVYDLYVLAMENVPGWWVDMPKILPTFNNLIRDLQARNPGLAFKPHLITRLGYGRDPYYRPSINTTQASASTLASASRIYFYPGLLDTTTFYYSSDLMSGNITVDGTPKSNADFPYAMADQYNHAVRAPDEERMYAEDRAAGLIPEPSLRMLLDRMNGGPGFEKDGTPYDYTNAIVVNLHGELFPLPPLRNYSDAAKLPESRRYQRAVSHPENLRYDSGSEVRLRVYSYVTKPEAFDDGQVNIATEPFITVVVNNPDVTATTVKSAIDAAVNVKKLVGHRGLDYSWADGTPATDYDVTVLSSTRTAITFKSTPLRHAKRSGGSDAGLSLNRRLYGLEYIPCVTAGTAFSNVFTGGTAGTLAADVDEAKNTARWVLRIPAGVLPEGMTTFETYIGSGTPVSPQTNMSRTYVWVGPDSLVPFSEKTQFLGDPRHMPYADIKAAKRYNWYFNGNVNGNGYGNFTRSDNSNLPAGGYENNFDHWGAGHAQLNMDLPRYSELIRGALFNTRSILSNVSGWLFYYVGLGGEIGLLERSFPTIHGRAWQPNDTQYRSVDEISVWGNAMNRQYVRLIAHASNDDGTATDWFSIPGLGDLYPDEAGAVWRVNGNLPTGNTLVSDDWTDRRYFRAGYDHNHLSIYGNDLGAPFSFRPRKQGGSWGPGSLFNGNDTGAGNEYFNQGSPANTATLTAQGGNVQDAFHLPLRATITDANAVSDHRPFRLNDGDATFRPPEWGQGAYSSQRTTLSLVETYYNTSASGFQATSGLVRVSSGTTKFMYVQPNGLGKQGLSFGASEIGKVSMISVMRSFLTLGAPSVTQGRVEPQPLVVISSPTATDDFNATTTLINVIWTPQWTRWDGQPYTEGYVGVFPGTPVNYNVKLSADGGTTWTHLDGTPAQKDVYEPGFAATSPQSWDVSGLAPGEFYQYILRVEGYSPNRQLHHSYHERLVYIRK